MQIKLNKIKQNNLIMFDIEYEDTTLIQLSMLIFQKQNKNIFQLNRSINIYIKPDHLLNNFFINYTNITDEFLDDNGIELYEAHQLITNLLKDIDISDTLFISHGIKNDMSILYKNGFDFSNGSRYCTCENAKRLLKRTSHLTLADIAAEGCYYTFNAHNAYADALSVVFAFCFLNEKEFGDEKI